MSLFSIAAYTLFIIDIYFSVYILRKGRPTRAIRLFSFMSFLGAIWAFGYAFVYSAKTVEAAWFWYRVSSIGWCISPTVFLHFVLCFTQKKTLINSPIATSAIYLPSLILLVKSLSGVLYSEDFIVGGPFGTLEVFTGNNIWYWVYLGYSIIYGVIILGILLNFAYKAENSKVRRQAYSFVALFLSTYFLLFLSNSIFNRAPFFLPSFGVLFTGLFVGGSWYVLMRYRMLNLTKDISIYQILDSMNDIVLLTDENKLIQECNIKFTKITGFAYQEIGQEHISKIITEKQGTSCLHLASERCIPVNVHLSPLENSFKDTVGYAFVLQDLRNEQMLKESRKRYKQLADATVEGIFVHDDGKIIEVNKAMTNLTGYTKQDLLNKNVLKLVSPESIDGFEKYLTSDSDTPFEFVLLKKDGSICDTEAISKPFKYNRQDVHIVSVRDVTERKQTEQLLQRLAKTDGLTNMYNRYYFEQKLSQEWKRLSRERKPIALILCDIDYFKNYNDTLGHVAGDNCLVHFSIIISECIHRPADILARYGGEEFAVLLPDTNEAGAYKIGLRIQEHLNGKIEHPASKLGKFLTVSMGIASLVPNAETPEIHLKQQADTALYGAKNTGRNKIVCSSEM